MKAPIFIFALPRSGSTLLQRMLMQHPFIASGNEPWIALLPIYARRSSGILSEFDYQSYFEAVNDFVSGLPGKEEDYWESVKVFLESMYSKYCKQGETYFLDKTPRYYEIIAEIGKIFPDGKFIFLFRDPRDVASSVIQTWGNGKLNNLYKFYRDLYQGPELLINGLNKLSKTAVTLNYESLIADSENCLKELCDYLEIPYDKSIIDSFSNSTLDGMMGDPNRNSWNEVHKQNQSAWKETFGTFFRKRFLREYLNSVDQKVWEGMGYDVDQMSKEINSIRGKIGSPIVDWIHLKYSWLVRVTNINIFLGQRLRKWAPKHYLS